MPRVHFGDPYSQGLDGGCVRALMSVTRAPRNHRLPKIGRRSSGQARITLGGVVHYLGRYGSLEAQRRYVELIEQWQRDDS